jgi:hypothetical protein
MPPFHGPFPPALPQAEFAMPGGQFMRAIQQNSGDENPFQKALRKKKGKGRGFDPRSAGFAQNQGRNARRLPTRRLQRGR